MSDQDLWRKNIPEDYDGRQGEHWDDEVQVGLVLKSGAALAITVLLSFGLCWLFMEGFRAFEEPVRLSPVLEGQPARTLPSPLLQASPEGEWDDMREQMTERLNGYGWSEQLDDRVFFPVDKAMAMILAGSTPVIGEPTADEPIAVDADAAIDTDAAVDAAADAIVPATVDGSATADQDSEGAGA